MNWVHCHSHGAVHQYEKPEDLWCTAVYNLVVYGEDGWAEDSTQLNYKGNDLTLARKEASKRGLWLYHPYRE